MNNNNLKRLRALAICSALTLILSAGCGKKEAPPAAAAPVESAPAAASDPAPQPVYAQPAPVDDVQAQMQQIDTRMQNQDYEGAVDAILRAQIAAQQQQAMISDQQRLDYHNRMRNVQKQIADAMASGDPNAERAARLLMQYNAARTQGR
jgi:hypothetical protein